jgi:hypothetical protein
MLINLPKITTITICKLLALILEARNPVRRRAEQQSHVLTTVRPHLLVLPGNFPFLFQR